MTSVDKTPPSGYLPASPEAPPMPLTLDEVRSALTATVKSLGYIDIDWPEDVDRGTGCDFMTVARELHKHLSSSRDSINTSGAGPVLTTPSDAPPASTDAVR